MKEYVLGSRLYAIQLAASWERGVTNGHRRDGQVVRVSRIGHANGARPLLRRGCEGGVAERREKVAAVGPDPIDVHSPPRVRHVPRELSTVEAR